MTLENDMSNETEDNLAEIPEDAEFPYDKGAGWYILSNGEKVRGRDQALEQEAALASAPAENNETETSNEPQETEETMAKTQTKAGDLTGRQREEKLAEQRQEQAERQERLTMANAQQRVIDETAIHDPRNGQVLGQDEEAEAALREMEERRAQEVELLDFGVETVEAENVVIRVNEDLPSVTIGAGNHYSFEMGKKYEVPRNVAAHLEEKGYVWH